MRKTGWFGRATEDGHNTARSGVHFIEGGKPVCGYKPAKAMLFQFCSQGFNWPYIECEKCKQKYRRMVQRGELK